MVTEFKKIAKPEDGFWRNAFRTLDHIKWFEIMGESFGAEYLRNILAFANEIGAFAMNMNELETNSVTRRMMTHDSVKFSKIAEFYLNCNPHTSDDVIIEIGERIVSYRTIIENIIGYTHDTLATRVSDLEKVDVEDHLSRHFVINSTQDDFEVDNDTFRRYSKMKGFEVKGGNVINRIDPFKNLYVD